MKNALLFANGAVTEKEIRRIRDAQFDLIIAADGGVRHALKFGYTPHVVIGDLDSISPEMRKKLPETRFIQRPSQELNDLHKALIYCETQGVAHLTLLGVCGKRLDHTLNNFSVIARFDQHFKLTIYDEFSQIFIVRNKWQFTGTPGQTISLIPIGSVHGVKTKGLKWTLNDESLNFGQREGCSNNISSNQVKISLKSGLLIVFVINSK